MAAVAGAGSAGPLEFKSVKGVAEHPCIDWLGTMNSLLAMEPSSHVPSLAAVFGARTQCPKPDIADDALHKPGAIGTDAAIITSKLLVDFYKTSKGQQPTLLIFSDNGSNCPLGKGIGDEKFGEKALYALPQNSIEPSTNDDEEVTKVPILSAMMGSTGGGQAPPGGGGQGDVAGGSGVAGEGAGAGHGPGGASGGHGAGGACGAGGGDNMRTGRGGRASIYLPGRKADVFWRDGPTFRDRYRELASIDLFAHKDIYSVENQILGLDGIPGDAVLYTVLTIPGDEVLYGVLNSHKLYLNKGEVAQEYREWDLAIGHINHFEVLPRDENFIRVYQVDKLGYYYLGRIKRSEEDFRSKVNPLVEANCPEPLHYSVCMSYVMRNGDHLNEDEFSSFVGSTLYRVRANFGNERKEWRKEISEIDKILCTCIPNATLGTQRIEWKISYALPYLRTVMAKERKQRD